LIQPPNQSGTILPAVLVLGMHRSGTSAMAGCLAQAGLQAPRTLLKPSPDNPKGYFESATVMHLNDEMLAARQQRWMSLRPLGALSQSAWPDYEAYVDKARAVIRQEFGTVGPGLVFKDPRVSRLLPVWDAALRAESCRPTAILMLRHPQEVAASLAHRDGFQLDFGALLWLRYMVDAITHSRFLKPFVVSYAGLVADPATTIARLVTGMGLPATVLERADEAGRFVSPELKRNQASAIPDSDAFRQAMVLYEQLRLHADSGAPADMEGVDVTTTGQWLDALAMQESEQLEAAAEDAKARRKKQRKRQGKQHAHAPGKRLNKSAEKPNDRQGESEKGIALLRARDFDAALQHWCAYWERAASDPRFASLSDPRFSSENRNRSLFQTCYPRLAQSGPESRLCIYTAVFGGYDAPPKPVCQPKGWDFICFTDQPAQMPGWSVRVVDPGQKTPMLNNRHVKLLPYQYLPDYDAALYVDANLQLLANPDLIWRLWLHQTDFLAFAHPQRSDALDECEAVLSNLRHPPDEVVHQYEYLCSRYYQRHGGQIEASWMWRNLKDYKVKLLMKAWWQTLVAQGGRDQPWLSYQMTVTGVRPDILPREAGRPLDNDFFAKQRHNKTAVDMWAHSSNVSEGEPEQSLDCEDRLEADSHTRMAPRALVWLVRNCDIQTATVMRGQQLFSMVENHPARDFPVEYVDETSLNDLNGQLLFLTRSFLKHARVAELEQLKSAGNIICVDNVDHRENPEFHPYVDVYIASSLRQLLRYTRDYPDRLVHLLTHNVDPDIPAMTPRQDQCRLAYFGELVNARHHKALAGQVDFVQTNNMDAPSRDWLQQISNYNLHYAVRKGRSIDDIKPFTKGFTAAHCGANIIVPQDESDARYYLTCAYPYLLTSNSLEAVEAMIDKARRQFGGPEWRLGLEIMASVKALSSSDHILGELRELFERASDPSLLC